MKQIDKIRELLGEEELLCQLAEEAAELAQAALKYRRCITGKNPTPVTLEEARANLIEEMSDVWLIADMVAGWQKHAQEVGLTVAEKTGRWVGRLEAEHHEN